MTGHTENPPVVDLPRSAAHPPARAEQRRSSKRRAGPLDWSSESAGLAEPRCPFGQKRTILRLFTWSDGTMVLSPVGADATMTAGGAGVVRTAEGAVMPPGCGVSEPDLHSSSLICRCCGAAKRPWDPTRLVSV